MEKPFDMNEEFMQELVKETGLEKPSHDFKSRVMDAIEQKADAAISYRPLLSKKGWFIITAIFVGSLAYLLFFPSGQFQNIVDMSFLDKFQAKNPFAGIEISKTYIYGIGFLSLFLIQIPFLKRLVEPKY